MRRRWHSAVILLAILASLCLGAYFTSLCTSERQKFHADRLEYHKLLFGGAFSPAGSEKSVKTILYWNGLWSDKDFELGEGYAARHCPSGYNNCFATSNRHLLPIESYDAILIHGNSHELSVDALPTKRSSHQKYVFVAVESPGNAPFNSTGKDDVWPRYSGYFNATMTYQRDSDVVYSYADVTELEEEDLDNNREGLDNWSVRNILGRKNKMAAWYVSHCKTKSQREKYVAELEKYMPVDKFGDCYEWWVGCPDKHNRLFPGKNRDCFREKVEPNYFFYLSFENSLCQDYVTEKFFNALKYYVVPVVYGGANYAAIAPPNSYIDALDFDSPEDLAHHLLDLSKNMKKYEQYFQWKERYKIMKPQKRVICDLCRLINKNEKKTYTVSEWYSPSRCPLQHQMHKQVNSDFATRKTKSLS